MKKKTAIKIAIECIDQKAAREYNIDATLFQQGVVKSPHTARCHKKLTRLEEAKAILEGIIECS